MFFLNFFQMEHQDPGKPYVGENLVFKTKFEEIVKLLKPAFIWGLVFTIKSGKVHWNVSEK